MMISKSIKFLVSAFMLASMLSIPVFAEDTGSSSQPSEKPWADKVSDCSSKPNAQGKKPPFIEPYNCIYLEEPIGGENNIDLYKQVCDTSGCKYVLYNGGALGPNETGPYQAILTADKNKPEQGSFTLLFGYVSLIYKFLSGIIIGLSVLFIVIGGIKISIYGANQGSVDEGKKSIYKAIIGLIIWFSASFILYTINPTFFNFLT